ncbi:MAG: 2-hydroxyacid dehydrogenase [Acidimicrobiia bacterium]
MSPPIVAVSRQLPAPSIEPLRAAGFEVRYRDVDAPCPPEELQALVAGADGLLCLLSERIDDAVLAAGPGLRIVANMAVGYDNVDVDACTASGVQVTNTPDVLTDATADLTWALILAVARRIGEGERLARTGRWAGWRPGELLGMGLDGKVLGIFGMGKIGRAVARRAAGFGMSVIYHNRRPVEGDAADTAEYVSRAELLARADVLVLNAPSTPETRHAIDAAALAAMKPTALLINTARGPLVDEAALVDALTTGRIAGAGLDVYEREPEIHPGLLSLDNAVLLPHLGSATREARGAMVQLACDNLVAVLGGGAPLTPVNSLG